ncbi:MAG TPA: GNAT family N-acetyltransferase [Stackebrandtia sp.]|uniref:GNAT family N-acetyltransferase n=1 Tax=Stackebrandtia sp. TaxID=2023065 RepID=UPI002D435A19|nr:GNAT family N-acetyltransferase [Stackebrandtia sp.]HZE41680.1 GNAT family N-acetyltransferase [Stackebrandtia sp.]
MDITIRTCRAGDVAALDGHNPSPSVESFHAQRFARQEDGASLLLVAWDDTVPVGHAEIRWHGCDAAHVRAAHPGCPEINGLEVFPPALRGKGIGTALVAACEDAGRDRGLAAMGLGVAEANQRARALYARLGYRGDLPYIDRYTCIDSMGTAHHFADPCRFLTKPLAPMSPAA